MKRAMWKAFGWTVVASGGCLLSGSCLPDNFWADKGGEILNLGIIAAINLVLGALSGGAIQI